MTQTLTSYFLLVYRLDTGEVVVEPYGDDDQAAAAAYTQREHEFRGDDRVEVVMVGADSLETVRKTHSHYFAGQPDGLGSELERQFAGVLSRG